VRSITATRISAVTAESGLLLLVVGAPLAIGAVHRPVIALAGLGAATALAMAFRYRRLCDRPFRVGAFGTLLLLLTAYTALQTVPLPLELLRLLAPATFEVLESSFTELGGAPAWHPVSLEPGNTAWEVVKIGTAAAVFLLASNLMTRSAHRTRLLFALTGTGVLVVLLGFIGTVAAPNLPLLFYRPAAGKAAGLIATSFVNPNHGAAFLVLCTISASGLALRQRNLQQRVLLALAGVLLGTGVFLTLSRGGMLALGLALSLFALLLATLNRARGAGSRQAAFVVAALGGIIALAGWLAHDAIASEIASLFPDSVLSLDKTALWPAGTALIRANWLLGVGRGAMVSALPRYLNDQSATVTFSHLENQYLHLPGEWGVVIGGVAIFGAVLAWAAWLRHGVREPLGLAAAAALASIAAQNAFDFNLELLGIGVPVTALAGMLAASAVRRKRQEEPHPEGHGRGTVVAVFAALLGSASLGMAITDPPSPGEDAAALQQLAENGTSYSAFLIAARDAVQRHPADYLPHVQVAQQAYLHNKPEALRWLNQALTLFPHNPTIHFQAAQVLRRLGRRRQALLECRTALENGASPRQAIGWALPLCRNAVDVERLLPKRAEIRAVSIAMLLERRRLEVAWQVAQGARELWPADTSLMAAAVRVQLARRRHSDALPLARRLALEYPTRQHYGLWAAVEEGVNGPRGAEQVLLKAVKHFHDDPEVRFQLALAHARAKNPERATRVALEALSQASDTATLARGHEVLSYVYRSSGRIHRANYEAEKARMMRQAR
jgi:tetratricopeptide (TPR) repeat protein